MCGTGQAEVAEVSGIAVDGSGTQSLEGEAKRAAGSERAELAAHSDPGVAGSGLEACGGGGCGAHLSARSATSGLALPGAGAGSRAERRSASQAREAARCQAASCDRSDGVRPASD